MSPRRIFAIWVFAESIQSQIKAQKAQDNFM